MADLTGVLIIWALLMLIVLFIAARSAVEAAVYAWAVRKVGREEARRIEREETERLRNEDRHGS